MPASRSRETSVASYGGTQPSRMREPAVVGSPLVVAMSLTAIGTPSRSGTSPPAERALVGGAGLRERAVGVDVEERVNGAVDGPDPVQVRLGHLDGRGVSAAQRVGDLGGREPGEVAHASSPRIRGTLNRCCSTSGAPASASSGDRHGAVLVRPEDVLQRERVRRRRDVVGGDLADLGDRLEDHRELRGEVVELGVGQVDPGQMGQVGDLVTAQRGGFGHAGNPMARRPTTLPGRTTPATRRPARRRGRQSRVGLGVERSGAGGCALSRPGRRLLLVARDGGELVEDHPGQGEDQREQRHHGRGRQHERVVPGALGRDAERLYAVGEPTVEAALLVVRVGLRRRRHASPTWATSRAASGP